MTPWRVSLSLSLFLESKTPNPLQRSISSPVTSTVLLRYLFSASLYHYWGESTSYPLLSFYSIFLCFQFLSFRFVFIVVGRFSPQIFQLLYVQEVVVGSAYTLPSLEPTGGISLVTKNVSVEFARKKDPIICILLHPGTVDTDLSQPFQRNVPKENLFSKEFSVEKLLSIMNNTRRSDNGKFFAWDGQEIPW